MADTYFCLVVLALKTEYKCQKIQLDTAIIAGLMTT